MPEITTPFQCHNLRVRVYDPKSELGIQAADYVANIIKNTVETKGHARVTFATGASQFDFLNALIKHDLPWPKVEAFHLDEYIGLPETHPASFRLYLRERLFDIVKPGQVHYLNGNTPILTEECERYTKLMLKDEIDLACIGIGENGHIAFNDPPVADFEDPAWVKIVDLDEACRQQQFSEGWFPSYDDVPKQAITQTVPAIMRSNAISCFVPDDRKADAVKKALYGPLSTTCPASILREHPNAVLWLDQPAASHLPLNG